MHNHIHDNEKSFSLLGDQLHINNRMIWNLNTKDHEGSKARLNVEVGHAVGEQLEELCDVVARLQPGRNEKKEGTPYAVTKEKNTGIRQGLSM